MTNAFEDLSEIHRNLKLRENKLVGVLFTPGFVATRDIVVEWISDVCKECSLARTTTAQAIALFDAILTNDDLMLKAPRSLYQQFACAAILIAGNRSFTLKFCLTKTPFFFLKKKQKSKKLKNMFLRWDY